MSKSEGDKMMNTIFKSFMPSVIVLLLTTMVMSSAQSALVSYTNRAVFEAAIGGSNSSEDFNGFVTDAQFRTTSVSANNMTIIGQPGTNGTTTNKIDASTFEFGGFYDLNNTSYLLGDLVGAEQIRINFGTQVTAWGADFFGIANVPRDTRISVYDSSNVLLGAVLPSSPTNSTIGFYGFALTAGSASYLTIGANTDGNDVFGLDDVAMSTVPIPAAVWLFGSALLGLFGITRRKQKAA